MQNKEELKKQPLRILHCVQSMNMGGIENMIMNLYRHIDRNKIQFDFIMTEPKKCTFEDEICELGGKIYRMPPIKIFNPFEYMKHFDAFLKEHKEYKIVHSHMNTTSVFPLYVAKKNGIKIRISHAHIAKAESGYRGVIQKLLRYPLVNIANYYFACGQDAANYVFLKNKNVIILNNSIDILKYIINDKKRQEYRKKYNIENKILIGHVGRFDEQKNHKFIIDVFKKIHDVNSNSSLLLLGDGQLRKDIEFKVKQLKLEKDVIFTGVVSNTYDYLNAMDIFLFPSLFEGLPVTLIEAQVSGLKCFVSDSVTREIDITDLVEFIPLNKSADYWANIILKESDYKRENRTLEIQKAGYDVNQTAKWLTDFYMGKANINNKLCVQ